MATQYLHGRHKATTSGMPCANHKLTARPGVWRSFDGAVSFGRSTFMVSVNEEAVYVLPRSLDCATRQSTARKEKIVPLRSG